MGRYLDDRKNIEGAFKGNSDTWYDKDKLRVRVSESDDAACKTVDRVDVLLLLLLNRGLFASACEIQAPEPGRFVRTPGR